MTASIELSKVYKANQCCDAADVQYAIAEVKRIANKYGWSIALCKRLASLQKVNIN